MGDGDGSGNSNVCVRAAFDREFLVLSGDGTGAGWWNELWLHETERAGFEDSRLLLQLSAEYAACNTAGADCGTSRSRLMWWRFEEAL